jgi:hypothetical protein
MGGADVAQPAGAGDAVPARLTCSVINLFILDSSYVATSQSSI